MRQCIQKLVSCLWITMLCLPPHDSWGIFLISLLCAFVSLWPSHYHKCKQGGNSPAKLNNYFYIFIDCLSLFKFFFITVVLFLCFSTKTWNLDVVEDPLGYNNTFYYINRNRSRSHTKWRVPILCGLCFCYYFYSAASLINISYFFLLIKLYS